MKATSFPKGPLSLGIPGTPPSVDVYSTADSTWSSVTWGNEQVRCEIAMWK